MTERERIERANRARMAMEEFFEPALTAIEHEYAERIISVSASTDPRQPEIVSRLGIGVQMARQIRAAIEAHIKDGQVAKAEMDRKARHDELTPPQRRLLSVAPH